MAGPGLTTKLIERDTYVQSIFKRLASLVVISLLIASCGDNTPVPSDLLPSNLSQLDANVVVLIDKQIAQIESLPHEAEPYAELGLIYEANLLWVDARRAYAAAVELQPTSTWWRFHLAIASRSSGDLAAAQQLLQQLSAEHPELAPVQQRLGEALTESGDLAAAETAYTRVIDLLPGSVEGYHGLGEVKILQQDYAAARDLLEQAVALDPRYRAPHYALGLAYRGLGRREDAQREMALGVDGLPRYLEDPLASQIQAYVVNLPALRNQAAEQLLSGWPDQAARLLEQILIDQPGNATDLNNLAIAYMRMGRHEDARASLEQARQVAPEKFSTWLNLSALATRMRDPEAALAYAEVAVERAPNMAQAHISLAMAEAELGYLERTAASLEQAVRLDENNPQAHGMLAEISVQLGRLDLAAEHFRIVLTLRPDSLTAVLKLGQLYLQQENLERAGTMLARANELAPGNARVIAFEREIHNYTAGEQQ